MCALIQNEKVILCDVVYLVSLFYIFGLIQLYYIETVLVFSIDHTGYIHVKNKKQ